MRLSRIEHKWITRAIETSQKRVEAHNFDIRKHLLEYDDVNNKQRTEIYSFRREILSGDNHKEKVMEIRVIMNNKIDKFKYYGVSKEERGDFND